MYYLSSISSNSRTTNATAAASQDFDITIADKIALWKGSNVIRLVNIYAKSSLATPTADASVTFDIAGS